MIRRGFWLAAGAVLGVTGYRRASRLAHKLRPASLVQGGRQLQSAASFVRDVRDGMADYRDLHGGQFGHSLGSRSLGNPGDRIQSARQQGHLEP
jgi:hypothetical protein